MCMIEGMVRIFGRLGYIKTLSAFFGSGLVGVGGIDCVLHFPC